MKKVILSLTILLTSFGAIAEDFKIGEAKYQVLENGTVELKENKKATGDVVIPEKVANPKTGQEYTVTSIGKDAFKKSLITSVVVPATVTSIGKSAFEECPRLTSAKLPGSITEIPEKCFYYSPSLKTLDMDLGNIRNVGRYAFTGTDVGTVAPVGYLMTANVLYTVYGIHPKGQNVGATYLLIYPDSDPGNINPEILTSCPVIIFTDPNASEQVLSVGMAINKSDELPFYIDRLEAIYKYGEVYRKYQSINDYMPKSRYGGIEPQTQFYIGTVETGDGTIKPSQDTPYSFWQGLDVALDNKYRAVFITKLEDFINTAINNPSNLRNCFTGIDGINTFESVKYNSDLRNAINALCDSIYLVKPELSKDEMENLQGFANDCLSFMGADYGISNMRLSEWAKADFLNKDVKADEHRADYERILKINERLLNDKDFVRENGPYSQATQLAALCGLGRWKEASSYFPKVHRAVTSSGKYAVPIELTYMQNEIKKHGFNATAPSYTSKKVSQGSNLSLVEFFMNEAIEAGVRHYEQKRAEKHAREMFYESIGLDKKGRPKK